MKVVIDTSVLVSAAFKDKDPESVLLFVATRPDWQWIVSAAILEEYEMVMRREKFGLTDSVIRMWHDIFHEMTTMVDVTIELPFPRDQKDAKFLECAIAANADYLVTSDKDFTEARKMASTTILSVAQFKRFICDPLSRRKQ